jgi:hypothetical protein
MFSRRAVADFAGVELKDPSFVMVQRRVITVVHADEFAKVDWSEAF